MGSITSVPDQRLTATARGIASLLYLNDNNPAIPKLALDVTQLSAIDAAFKAAAYFIDSCYIDVVHEMHDEFEVNFFSTVCVALKGVNFSLAAAA
ncbi:unnamed protein product [Penicillium discolor]